jgi:hypothetical protein
LQSYRAESRLAAQGPVSFERTLPGPATLLLAFVFVFLFPDVEQASIV